ELFDTYGGAEGIEEKSNQADAFADEMDKFSQGDREFISKLAKDDPEGFAKSASAMLTHLGVTNPDAYEAALVPILNITFEKTGITNGVIEAGSILNDVYGAL